MPEESDLLMFMREASLAAPSKHDAPLLAALKDQFKNDPVKFIQRLEAMENNYLISTGKDASKKANEMDAGSKRAVEHAEKLLKAILEEGNATPDQGVV